MESYFAAILSPEVLAFFSVVLIDLVLSADNGLIVGLAAASLPPEQRKKAIAIGIVLATLFRVFFAAITVQLLAISRHVVGRRVVVALCFLQNVERLACRG